jgi:hypothetical protein
MSVKGPGFDDIIFAGAVIDPFALQISAPARSNPPPSA